MKTLLLMLLTQAPVTQEAVRSLRPELPVQRVVQVSKAIDAAARRYAQDPVLLAAITELESGFRSGIRACWVVLRYRSCQVTCDYGIAQVNELWIQKWRLDPMRLLYDDQYNLSVAARILANLEREFGDEPTWYGRYHSGTRSKRAEYESRLLPLLQGLRSPTVAALEVR